MSKEVGDGVFIHWLYPPIDVVPISAILSKNSSNLVVNLGIGKMGKIIRCIKCKGELFRISKNPYSEDILDHPHIEIFCSDCGYGIPVKVGSIEWNK